MLTAPIASVAALSAVYASPFNAVVFAGLTLVLLAVAMKLDRHAATIGPSCSWMAGTAMVGFGWIYPHFLDERSIVAYLYGSPLGLVPCPTLSLVIGGTLIAGGLSSRVWSGVVAVAGLFYGLFGAFRLGVTIDLLLAAGSVVVGAMALRGRGSSRSVTSAPSA